MRNKSIMFQASMLLSLSPLVSTLSLTINYTELKSIIAAKHSKQQSKHSTPATKAFHTIIFQWNKEKDPFCKRQQKQKQLLKYTYVDHWPSYLRCHIPTHLFSLIWIFFKIPKPLRPRFFIK